jgi:branched-chain amino acid transport system substrate-binding protein
MPNYVALEGFINAKVLVKTLQDAGRDLTRAKFIAALEAMHNVDIGIGKQITYGNLDHGGLEGIYYSKVAKDGTFRIFEPK